MIRPADFNRLKWKTTAKGQRSGLGPDDWPAGTYVLKRDWGIPDVKYRRGQTVHLSQEEATRLGRAEAIIPVDS